jgi:hypothetical protein
MFAPLVHGRRVDLETLNELADSFRMSKTATAIKLVKHGSLPAILAYYEAGNRKWFIRGDGIPGVFTPPTRLGRRTLTAELADGQDQGSDDTRTDHWFDHSRADRYYVRESCFRTGPESLATILWWEDEQQLIDFEEEQETRWARRSDSW